MTTSMPQINFGLGDDFLVSYSNVPKGKQKKVREFISKFQENPTSPGINYETINATADKNLRSVRIDKEYRGIVLKPKQGNTYVLLWVDKHDDAYKWAEKQKCAVHPETGTIQVYPAVSVDQTDSSNLPDPEEAKADKASTKKPEQGLFDPFTDTELVAVGLPEPLLNDVRKIAAESDLYAIEKRLPTEASEALFYLAAGFSLEETKDQLGITPLDHVDTTDFAAALNRETTKRKFVVVTDAEEMQKILSYPLDRWRTFLHPSQKKLVQMQANGPVRVLGGAGTGKTVVAIHRAKMLAETVCTAKEKILFTTFTKNLVADIEGNLRKLCSHETLQKIEVINLDAWAHRLLKSNGIQVDVDFTGKRTKPLWEEAMTSCPDSCPFSEQEMRDEWERVVQAQSINDEASYIRASRVGMGQRLSRAQRKLIWPVFEEYRSLLKAESLGEPIDALRQARQLIESRNLVLPYRSVLVDEAQDFSAEAFRLVRAIIPEVRARHGNDLFIVGDAHQRIYGHKVVLSHCGINIVGRSRKLRINYRTTEETRNWATAILQECAIDDLDGGLDSQQGYRSLFHGEPPSIESYQDEKEELTAIAAHLAELNDQGAEESSICVVARTSKKVKHFQEGLQGAGYPTRLISSQKADDHRESGIRVATMHRVKGIEFDHIVLAGMDKSTWRWFRRKDEKTGESTLPVGELSLIYVAATRARKSVQVTGAGELLSCLKSGNAQ